MGKITDEFPGAAALIEDGRFTTEAKIDAATDEELLTVPNIGDKTVGHIRAAREAAKAEAAKGAPLKPGPEDPAKVAERDDAVILDKAEKAVTLDQNETARQAPDSAAPAIVAREAKEDAEAEARESDVRRQGGDDPGRPNVLASDTFFSGGGVGGTPETGTPPGAPGSTLANDLQHGGVRHAVDHATTPALAEQRAFVAERDQVQATDNAILAKSKAEELRRRADEAQATADSLRQEAEFAELQAADAGGDVLHKVRVKLVDRKGEEVLIRGDAAGQHFDEAGVAVGVTNEGVRALQARFGAEHVQVLD
jgi:hypothetical protein